MSSKEMQARIESKPCRETLLEKLFECDEDKEDVVKEKNCNFAKNGNNINNISVIRFSEECIINSYYYEENNNRNLNENKIINLNISEEKPNLKKSYSLENLKEIEDNKIQKNKQKDDFFIKHSSPFSNESAQFKHLPD